MVNASAEPPEFERLREIADPFLRRLYFVAILTKYLPSAARPVVVGDHALQFHTSAHYATGPVDLACPDRQALGDLLGCWGFESTGCHWVRDDLDLYLGAAADVLDPEQAAKVIEGEIEGLTVPVVGAEDVLLDRLNGFVHGGYGEDGVWAEQIILMHSPQLDWEYLQRVSERDGTDEALREMRRHVEVEHAQES